MLPKIKASLTLLINSQLTNNSYSSYSPCYKSLPTTCCYHHCEHTRSLGSWGHRCVERSSWCGKQVLGVYTDPPLPPLLINLLPSFDRKLKNRFFLRLSKISTRNLLLRPIGYGTSRRKLRKAKYRTQI